MGQGRPEAAKMLRRRIVAAMVGATLTVTRKGNAAARYASPM